MKVKNIIVVISFVVVGLVVLVVVVLLLVVVGDLVGLGCVEYVVVNFIGLVLV